MRRVPIILLIAAILLCSGGCADIDWKAHTKAAFAKLLEQVMSVAIDQYGDKKVDAVAWTINYVEGIGWARPVLKWVDYEGLIEHAYDRIWASWYRMLRAAEYDTDAFMARESKIFALMDKGIVCPNLQDELVEMME